MHRYRDALPQLGGDLFLTDGGIETTLIFHEGLELPHFAAFHLLKSAAGESALRKYFERYAALERVDDATSGAPAYYMINCAHTSHFSKVLLEGGTFVERIRGLRANASRMSHAELNDAPALDEGSPDELGAEYARIRRALGNLNVMGGCCGTDHRHVEAIARACISSFGGS